MDKIGWLGLGFVVGGGAVLLKSLRPYRKKEKEWIERLRESIRRGERIEITLEEIGACSWLQKIPLRSQEERAYVEHSPEDGVLKRENRKEDSLRGKLVVYQKDLSEKAKAFVDETIIPLAEVLEREGTLEPVLKVLVLLSRKGNIPSVVGEISPKESVQYRILKKVTLEEHSLEVARRGMEILKEELPYVYDISPGKYLLIFLGHDLGKIYAVEEGYVTGDHPVISARILNEIIPDGVEWKTSALITIWMGVLSKKTLQRLWTLKF